MPGTEGVDYVIAKTAIADPDLERHVYGAGDRVPIADAIKYGLVAAAPTPEAEEQPTRGRRSKHGPDEDRAKHGPDEDR